VGRAGRILSSSGSGISVIRRNTAVSFVIPANAGIQPYLAADPAVRTGSGRATAPRGEMAHRSGRHPCPHPRPRDTPVPLAPSPPASLRLEASGLRLRVRGERGNPGDLQGHAVHGAFFPEGANPTDRGAGPWRR